MQRNNNTGVDPSVVALDSSDEEDEPKFGNLHENSIRGVSAFLPHYLTTFK